MNDTTTNPLVRALAALDRLEPAEKASDEAALWREAREGLLTAMQEREAFLVVVGTAAGLIDVLDSYNEVLEKGDEERIAELALAGTAAEDALAEALDQVQDLLAAGEGLSEHERLLEILDHFADNNDEEPRR